MSRYPETGVGRSCSKFAQTASPAAVNGAGRENELRYMGIGRPGGPTRTAAAQATQGEITMPIPQVNDRIKEAPAVMLRAVFAGVGQLLLAADRVRSRAAGTSWPADRTAPKGRARAQSRWHTLDDTRSGTAPIARERADSYSHSAARPSASATTSPAPATAPTADAPPLPGYDGLSLPSLRARMRVL